MPIIEDWLEQKLAYIGGRYLEKQGTLLHQQK